MLRDETRWGEPVEVADGVTVRPLARTTVVASQGGAVATRTCVGVEVSAPCGRLRWTREGG